MRLIALLLIFSFSAAAGAEVCGLIIDGAPHANGGGFVAKTASVAKTAFVGPQAAVCGHARVEGNARVFTAHLESGNITSGDH